MKNFAVCTMDQGEPGRRCAAPFHAVSSRVSAEESGHHPGADAGTAKAIADAEGLHYVYIGNVPGHPAQNTYCPKCRKLLVERVGFTASTMLIRKNSCPFCSTHPRSLARMRCRGGLAMSFERSFKMFC